MLMRFLRDTSAATAVEYAMIAAGVAAAIAASVQGFGAKVMGLYSSVNEAMN